jgi:hypothetical protein
MDNLYLAQKACWDLTEQLLTNNSGTTPLEVAASMMSVSMSLYKTVLTEEDFGEVIDTIFNLRDSVKRIKSPNLQ